MDDDRALIAELTELALAEAAPEELAVFEETAQEFFDDPEGALSAAGQDSPVGFGLDLVMITPAALAVGTVVVQALIASLSERAVSAGASRVSALVRRLFRKGPPEPEGIALTAEQVRHVRQVALDRARALGMPEQQANLLADAFVGAIVTTG